MILKCKICNKNQTERDERRKQEIINHLGCEFIELYEMSIYN